MVQQIKNFAVAMIMAAVFNVTAKAAPGADAWEIWVASNQESTLTVSHDKWQTILDKYLADDTDDGVNLFAYGKVSDLDKALLKEYLSELTAQDPRALNKDEQMAYWINLYNALTIDVVLDEYPVSSIRKIRFLTSPFGPWDKSLVEIDGEDLTLNDIEHRILRPIWQDPRIHFAVNCASIGCPNLQGTVFTAANLESLLDKGAVEFINHGRGVGGGDGKLKLSSIFDWYGDDFGSDVSEIVEYLGDFMDEDRQSLLTDYESVSYDYDWSLNESK